MFNTGDLIEIQESKYDHNKITINRGYITHFEETSDGGTIVHLISGRTILSDWNYEKIRAAICGYVRDSRRVIEELPQIEK